VSTSALAEEEPITPGRRRLIAFAMTTAAAMQGMDTISTAVALPEIRGVMSATADEAAWVLTSFLVAAAIFTPLFAWMSRRFGRRRLLLCMIFGFLVSTILVAQSSSLAELVAYRFLQGVAAAGMGPLSNQVMLATYPKELHGAAFSWLTSGRMSGVMFGPLIGGVLTEYLSWHWIYLSNIPLALLGFWLVWRFVPEAKERAAPRFDFFGFFALSVAIGALQLMLDRGERQGWFESGEIVVWAALCLVALYLFAIHVLTVRNAYIDPRVFANRDFLIGLLFIFVLSIMIVGFASLLPPILQRHMNYPISTSGLLMMPRGIGTMIASVIAGPLLMRMQPRPLVFVGIALMALSTWGMSQFTHEVDAVSIALMVGLQGAGFGFFSVSVTAMAFQTLSPALRPDGTSLLSLSRRLGSSVGVSFLVSQFLRNTQSNRAGLIEHISPYNTLLDRGLLPEQWDTGTLSGLSALAREVQRQAEFLAYLQDFQMMAILIVFLAPLVFLLRGRPKE
jgi:MFS transporter, DHA2 family, multidrug resistance protein